MVPIDAKISLAQYFGTNMLSSESDRFVQDCDSEEVQKSCYEKCGSKHVCLLGQCICFEDTASPWEDEESEEMNTGAEIVKENESRNKNVYVLKTLQCLISQHRNTKGHSNRASNEESNSVDENKVAVPVLRHHIAHFCPNLDDARVCIRKCMKLDLPAFCGKDHVCYCGHKDEHSIEKLDPTGELNPFKDLYEKYFGIPKQY